MSELLPGQAAWQIDPDAAFVEARRRIVACAGQKSTGLYFGDLALDRLPNEISSLTGLRNLSAFGGRISDYTVLAPLTEMEELEIGSMKCPFPGLDFMRGWEKLKTLEIITPSAVDVKPAARCLDLKRLSIWCTATRVDLLNLDALSGLRAVEHVSLYGMASERFDTLTQWPRLKFIQLTNPTLATLAGFERLNELEYLSVSRAPISDLLPLADLVALKELIVYDTEVSDLSPLVRLPRLEVLDISGTHVSDLEPLERLGPCQREFNQRQRSQNDFWYDKGLNDIRISKSKVTNLAPLAGIETLQNIDLSDTAVTSLAPLHHKSNLRHVTLVRSAVTDLGPRGTLSGLVSINLAETGIRDLLALEPARSLGSLNISQTGISDLTPIRRAYECRSLNLRGSQVADIRQIIDTGREQADHRYSREALDFRDTPAARVNDRFAELAALADGSENSSTPAERCFFETKSYLRQLMGIRAKL